MQTGSSVATNDVQTSAPTTVLGRYQILKHLAQGGMADVLLARTRGIEGFERHVVIKRIRAEQARDERYVTMFLDEARLAATLHHHNVVQVNDIGEQDGEYFFAMEYVHGEDVRALLMRLSSRGEQVPLEHVITIITAAAAGLHHAHEQRGPDRTPLGIVHRDVSPANILIGYDGGVKVADFGIAKAAHRTVETRSGTLKGKVAYMSPEQCVGEAVDRRSDVFSLGIVLYELATVRRLFKGDNDFLTMTSIVLGHIPAPSKFRPDLPPELEDIILKALGNKPGERYASADEMRLALEQLAAKLGLRTSSTTLADYVKQQFGERPEPWLVEEEPDCEVSIDFDGSASGIVQAPLDAVLGMVVSEASSEATPAPIARARRRAITAGQAPEWITARAATEAATEIERPQRPMAAEPLPMPEPPAADPIDEVAALEPSAAIDLAIPAVAPRHRPRRVIAAIAAVAVALIAASILLVAPRDADRAPEAAAQPALRSQPRSAAPRVTPPAAPAGTTSAPPAPQSTTTVPVAPATSPSASTSSATTTPIKKPSRLKSSTRPASRKRWDPRALFPE